MDAEALAEAVSSATDRWVTDALAIGLNSLLWVLADGRLVLAIVGLSWALLALEVLFSRRTLSCAAAATLALMELATGYALAILLLWPLLPDAEGKRVAIATVACFMGGLFTPPIVSQQRSDL